MTTHARKTACWAPRIRSTRLGISWSDKKRRTRLNRIKHLLSFIPYTKVSYKKVKLPKRSHKHQYDDQATLKGRRFIPEAY